MELTRDTVAHLNNMEVAQVLGTLWMMKNAPEALPFISDMNELAKTYQLLMEENMRRFGVPAVTKMLHQMDSQLKLRQVDLKKMFEKQIQPKNAQRLFVIRNSENENQYLRPITPTANTYVWQDGLIGAAGFLEQPANVIAKDCKPKGVIVPLDSIKTVPMKKEK